MSFNVGLPTNCFRGKEPKTEYSIIDLFLFID
jgi:hypothetical protein